MRYVLLALVAVSGLWRRVPPVMVNLLGLASHEASRFLLAIAILVVGCWSAIAADLVGIPRIVDGDTIVLGDTHIRLEGVDAPETDQTCLDTQAKPWACGIAARDQLAHHIGSRQVSCASTGIDRYGLTLARCSVDGEDLNGWLVREGLALAYVKYSRDYVTQEAAAREHQQGLWSGAFIAPWDWRHRDQQTVVLGALSVPITTQSILLAPESSTGAPSPDCIIKGNANRSGERIYHMPGQSHYASVNMGKPGVRWFCTELEAQAAGWRRSKN